MIDYYVDLNKISFTLIRIYFGIAHYTGNNAIQHSGAVLLLLSKHSNFRIGKSSIDIQAIKGLRRNEDAKGFAAGIKKIITKRL